MTDAIDKLTQAKTRLSLKEPFFSTMLYRFPLRATEEVPVAAVTPRGVILYNPKAIERLSAFAPRFTPVLSWFDEYLASAETESADAILFDLGISMFHYAESGRGSPTPRA